MRIKTISLIIITTLLTVVIMQNNQDVQFNILFFQVRISNLLVIAAFALIGFVMGLVVRWSKKSKITNTTGSSTRCPADDPTETTLHQDDANRVNPYRGK